MGLQCWKCGASLKEVPKPLSRLSRCLNCYSDLYCCRMCRKYSPQYTGKCSDERADPPLNKQGANFCDWFTPDPGAYSGTEQSAEQQARDQLGALFGSTSEQPSENQDSDDQDSENISTQDKVLAEARRIFGGDDD